MAGKPAVGEVICPFSGKRAPVRTDTRGRRYYASPLGFAVNMISPGGQAWLLENAHIYGAGESWETGPHHPALSNREAPIGAANREEPPIGQDTNTPEASPIEGDGEDDAPAPPPPPLYSYI